MEIGMSEPLERRNKVKSAMQRIRALAPHSGVSKADLGKVRDELLELAAHHHLFSLDDFPPPEPHAKIRSRLYRLSEDSDHRFALYVNVADGIVNSPAHDHTTWAVIVGVQGQERNVFYRRTDSGVAVTGQETVEPGKGIVLTPTDLHSIHISGEEPVLNFHMYGLGLEQLPARNFWHEKAREWRVFPAHTDIRDAR
jgi:predicted metal-dependent enzyme (double-stranded beta helix superfamily)